MKGRGERRLLALASKDRLVRILEKMLDEDEFLSEYGIRSCVFVVVFFTLSFIEFFFHMLGCDDRLSKKHKDQPWGMHVHGQRYEVNYWPGDSKSGMFGGNSNWRGPICGFSFFLHLSIVSPLVLPRELTPHTLLSGLAVNFLLVESLQRFYQYYGDEVEVGKIFVFWFSTSSFTYKRGETDQSNELIGRMSDW